MAIVKIKYARKRGAIKAHLRYITHRRGLDKQTTTRTLFNEGGALTKQAAYELIDSAKRGTVFYKVILSPDPKREDTKRDLDLRQFTRQTSAALTATLNQPIRFLAVEHNDHAPHRHVHAIFLIPGRLSRAEFRLLAQTARLSATQDARLQRKIRDLALQNPSIQKLRRSLRAKISHRSGGGSLPKLQSGCPSCGFGLFSGIPAFFSYCPSCHERLREKRQKRLRWEVEG